MVLKTFWIYSPVGRCRCDDGDRDCTNLSMRCEKWAKGVSLQNGTPWVSRNIVLAYAARDFVSRYAVSTGTLLLPTVL